MAKPKKSEAGNDEKSVEGVSVIPPAPPMSAEAGDKTPEYVAWFKEHHASEFEARYGKRQGTNITK